MAQRKNTTPWFPGRTKPVRVGVYLRKVSHSWEMYSYWDGHMWHFNSETPDEARYNWPKPSVYQKLRWCGLLEKHNMT